MRGKATHHDGTNYYTFRAWKKGIDPDDRDDLVFDLYNGKRNKKKIDELTYKLGPEIAKVYGWEVV